MHGVHAMAARVALAHGDILCPVNTRDGCHAVSALHELIVIYHYNSLDATHAACINTPIHHQVFVGCSQAIGERNKVFKPCDRQKQHPSCALTAPI